MIYEQFSRSKTMIDFTELPDKWRDFRFDNNANIIGPLYGAGYYDACKHLADGLEKHLPKWQTLDPNDESTWPEDGKVYLVSDCCGSEFAQWKKFGGRFDKLTGFGWIGINDCTIQYREKCSIDSPPEKDDG